MKQRVLLVLAILLLISSVSAILNVGLLNPEDEYPIDQLQVTFSCVASGGVENITLILKQDEVPFPLETKDATDWQQITFDYTFPTGGTYLWNCLAKDSENNEFLASKDFTLEVNVNTPPIINCTIPNQEKDLNAGSWVLDLSGCKKDVEDQLSDLKWSVTNVQSSFCDVQIIGDVATFTPHILGSHSITFILTDSGELTDTQNVDIIITQTSSPSNNPPTISSIPDQNKDLDDSDWTLDLISYIDDDEDNDELDISVSGQDSQIYTISVDNETKELTFHIEGEGTDDFTLTVKDSQGATDSETITVSIEEETTDDDDDEFTDYSNDEFTVEIISSSPSYNNINIKPEQSQKFTITTNEDADIVWYIDNTKQDETSKSFTFTPTSSDVGEHIIKVVITSETNSNDKDTKTWDIEVEGTTISSICGNNKVDNNETCLSCPKDVPCKEGEYCDEGICKTKQLNKVTGFFTNSKNFILDKWYYPTLILSIILLIIIITTIIRMNKKPKKEEFLSEFSEEQTFWKRIQKRLRNWDKKRKLKRENKENLKRLETNKKENIRATAPGLDSITTFINQKIYEGNTKREIRKALRKKGWSRKQIRKAFKKIKNDSRKSNTGNQNPSQ